MPKTEADISLQEDSSETNDAESSFDVKKQIITAIILSVVVLIMVFEQDIKK